MLSCEVICDLMVVYDAGEASPETRRLVEEHLARCPTCREAFGEGQAVEDALADVKPVERPANGGRFIARTRRLLYAFGAGTLLLFGCVLAAFERIVMEAVSGIPLPHVPGSGVLWLTVMVVALVLYLGLLVWSSRREGGKGFRKVLFWLLMLIPLLVTAVVACHLVSTATPLLVLAAVLALLAALTITFVLLPRLPYMTLATVLVLLLVNGLLVGRAVAGVVALGDYSWQTPAELGHPPEGVALEKAARVHLASLGLEWTGSTEVTWVDNVWVGLQAQAIRATYEGDGLQAFLTVVAFESSQEADQFFVSWKDAVSEGVRLAHFEINLPGLPGQARSLRSYSAQTGRAYSAWQTESWMTIVEVPGPFSQASPLAREIKEAVASSYEAE